MLGRIFSNQPLSPRTQASATTPDDLMKEAADSLMVQDLASLHEELDDPELKDLLRESVGTLLAVRQEAKTAESQFIREHEDYMATIASIKTQNVELTPD